MTSSILLGFECQCGTLHAYYIVKWYSCALWPSLDQSRSQRLRSFWSAPRKQDLWANQCQNPAIRNLIGLLYFTGSLFESEVSKTGNMERHQKLGEAKNAIEMPSNVHSIFCSEKTRKDNKCTWITWLYVKGAKTFAICGSAWQSWMNVTLAVVSRKTMDNSFWKNSSNYRLWNVVHSQCWPFKILPVIVWSR